MEIKVKNMYLKCVMASFCSIKVLGKHMYLSTCYLKPFSCFLLLLRKHITNGLMPYSFCMIRYDSKQVGEDILGITERKVMQSLG